MDFVSGYAELRWGVVFYTGNIYVLIVTISLWKLVMHSLNLTHVSDRYPPQVKHKISYVNLTSDDIPCEQLL